MASEEAEELGQIDAIDSGSMIGVPPVTRPFLLVVDEIAVDENLKIVSTPAYMLGPSIAHVAKGIDALVNEVLSLA